MRDYEFESIAKYTHNKGPTVFTFGLKFGQNGLLAYFHYLGKKKYVFHFFAYRDMHAKPNANIYCNLIAKADIFYSFSYF